MINDAQTVKLIRKLTSGDVVCSVTAASEIDFLMSDNGAALVDEALHFQGMRLRHSQHKDYWFASYEDLNSKEDVASLKRELQHVLNATEPFIAFMKLIMDALGEDQYPDIEHDFYFGAVLAAIESSETMIGDLTKLTNRPFFKKAAARNTLSDRLRAIIGLMESEGIIITDDAGSHYIFTGKLAYHISLIERVFEAQAPELLEDENDSENMELF